jgi:hypothetical protein
MGIVKKNVDDVDDYSAFQLGVISILDDYDYDILDLRYIEEFKQIVITIAGLVLFITPNEISISFEITTMPEFVANLILILAERIPTKVIHVTDSFIITKDTKGERIAVFGSDAQAVYQHDLASRFRDQNDYLNVLKSPNVKFYNC